ncbi:RNA-directed DNA polymerase, eukaryota, reverse transcriptase zinc-binding domain protein, partial [Tanacetum coccineum]
CKNFFIGCDEGEKKLTWVKWKKCLACKKKGGLGIGSINALNLGLLFKWLWRFRCQSHDLWAKVITCVYGVNGGFNDDRVFPYSTWGVILSSVKRLNLNGIDLLALCTKKIGNGACTSFWNDPWRAPRGGIESSQLVDLLSAISAINLSDQPDSWVWSLNPAVGFTVASVRKLIDINILVGSDSPTRWNRSVPIKVNVFLWRLALNKLPTRVNLDRKGIDVDSTLCPICGDDVETINHLFFTCEMARVLWANLACWWDLDVPFCSSFSDWICWLDSSHLSAKGKLFLDGVGGTVLWTIWNYRNRLIFSVDPPKKASLWDFIVSQSFLWISSRNPKFSFSWLGWIQYPLVSIVNM